MRNVIAWFRTIQRWPMVFIGSVVLLVVMSTATVRERYRGWKVDREIEALQRQADELEGRNAQLRALAETLHAPERMEVEARTRLGLRQPGEHVLILRGLATTGSWQGSIPLDVVPPPPVVTKSNPRLWLEYFVNPETAEG
jgi:cell division protein FtsB